MKNKRTNNHSSRGNIIYQTRYISKLIEERKIKQAKLLINDLLKEYPDDNILVFECARILSMEGNYEEAYDRLSSLEEHDQYYHFFLTVLAILSKNYEAMEYYYNEYFANETYQEKAFKETQQVSLQIYLQKIFEPDKTIDINSYPNSIRNSYFVRQMVNYDENLAYNHIANRHVYHQSPNKTIFNPAIDIKKLMGELKELIEEHQGESHLTNLQEVYYFYYPQCGKTSEEPVANLNHLVASTIFNTSDILTIYPCRDNSVQRPIMFPIEKDNNGKELKLVSQIDKFNMRYGNKK